jgi:hypothetical protein
MRWRVETTKAGALERLAIHRPFGSWECSGSAVPAAQGLRTQRGDRQHRADRPELRSFEPHRRLIWRRRCSARRTEVHGRSRTRCLGKVRQIGSHALQPDPDRPGTGRPDAGCPHGQRARGARDRPDRSTVSMSATARSTDAGAVRRVLPDPRDLRHLLTPRVPPLEATRRRLTRSLSRTCASRRAAGSRAPFSTTPTALRARRSPTGGRVLPSTRWSSSRACCRTSRASTRRARCSVRR